MTKAKLQFTIEYVCACSTGACWGDFQCKAKDVAEAETKFWKFAESDPDGHDHVIVNLVEIQ